MGFREEIEALLATHDVPPGLLEVPPDPELGDFALPCFSFPEPKGKAAEIAKAVEADFLDRVEVKGPYVNFFIKPGKRAKRAIADAGQVPELGKRKIMIEYSQPNTHKAFHVGHLRGTCLGESLARILRAVGSEVVRANYSGDTGAHIAKWLWYYTTHQPGEPPEDRHELERWIADVYVRAVKELDEHPEKEEEVNEVLRKLEDGSDEELMAVYEETRKRSLEAFEAIYEDLHAHFDVWYFEGDVEPAAKAISRRLVEEGIARVDDGATIVDLEDEDLGIWVLLRQDGTALYSAKDLALAERKFDEYDIEESVYVVGHAQSMHLRQLFATLGRMDFPHAEQCSHLSFAEVRLPEGKMSSRTGRNILYSDMRDEVHAYAREEIEKRHEDWPADRVGEIADKVTVAALKWDMLAIHPNKVITFDPRQATEFEGETGPYVQYTFARANSIVKKAGHGKRSDGKTLTHEKEQAVVRLLEGFPAAVEKAAEEHLPSHVANHAMQLCKAFNSFYHECQVVGSPSEKDRLALVDATIAVLRQSLELLAIDAPEEM